MFIGIFSMLIYCNYGLPRKSLGSAKFFKRKFICSQYHTADVYFYYQSCCVLALLSKSAQHRLVFIMKHSRDFCGQLVPHNQEGSQPISSTTQSCGHRIYSPPFHSTHPVIKSKIQSYHYQMLCLIPTNL